MAATRYAAVVTRPGWVRTCEGELRCPDAGRLPVGSRIEVEMLSTSRGEFAVMAGGSADFGAVNEQLRGNPWTGQNRWGM